MKRLLALAGCLVALSCQSPSDPSPTASFDDGDVDSGVAISAAPSQPGSRQVEVLVNEWGPGACHTNGGMKRFRITNTRKVSIYSRLSAYTDDELTCATQEQVTGDPKFEGPQLIKPGESAIVTYYVQVPSCGSLQTDDCWGPGDLRECKEAGYDVLHDAFKSSRACPRPTPSPSPPQPTPSPSPPEPSPSPTCSPSPPGPICHVSNAGYHWGINLQVSYKRNGLGHQGHCADFTPSDFSASTGSHKKCKSHDPRCSCEVALERWGACAQ